MAEDEFKTHVLDGPSEGDEPQAHVPEDNPLVHGPAHTYDPHSELSPNEVAEREAEEARPKRKAPAKSASKTEKKEND